MMSSRPSPASTSTFFFTVRLSDPASDLLVSEIALLRDCVRLTRQVDPFVIDHAVVLPNRLHMIWTLKAEDCDYGRRWKAIKTAFAQNLPARHRAASPAGRSAIWQRRYWESPVRSPEELATYVDVIAQAPVEEGLVRRAGLWPYSSVWTARLRRGAEVSALRAAG